MMTDKQLEQFIAEVQDAITDAQEHFGASRIEILSTILAVALGGIRSEARKSGDLDEIEKDLEKIGIIMQDVEDYYHDNDVPPDETIH
tara:strand:+ start:1382 stop:1645 length:264 start_codon:yes stop_codon:yes gene_type:complete